MRKSTILCSVLALTATGLAAAPIALAQDAGNTFMGARSSVGGCPAVEWHILPPAEKGAAVVNGVAYYVDMSGVSIIKANIAADGSLAGALISVSGKGPAGTISGKRDGKLAHIEVAGDTCSTVKLNMQRFVAAGSNAGN